MTLQRALHRVRQLDPQYATKLEGQFAQMDGDFFARAERFLAQFERSLTAMGKTLDYGVDCHMKLRASMIEERKEFLRTGRYASQSFAEVQQRVYANPGIMEYHMRGLVFSQFFWREQYARLEFFCKTLPQYRGGIASYLELGGGHGIYISCASEILDAGTHLELTDISPTSLALARSMSLCDRIQYQLCNAFDYPEGRQFDLVVAGEILEHLEEPGLLLRKIRSMLSPRGRAFISTPVNSATVDHIYLFRDVQEIRDLLASESLTIESEVTCYSEDIPERQAKKLKVAQMFAAFVRS